MARVAQELGFSIWIVTFGTISGIPESSFSIAISKYCGKRGTPKYSFSIANLTFVSKKVRHFWFKKALQNWYLV